MNSYSDMPHDFKAKVFSDYVRIVTGNAIITSQYVERVFKFFCVALQVEGIRLNLDDFLSSDIKKIRFTLGTIEKKLSNTKLFEPSFSKRLSKFVKSRNRIVHGLFVESFEAESGIHFESKKAQNYVKECEWVCKEGDKLIDVGFGIYRTLGNILLKSNPDNKELNKVIHRFDSYEKRGLNAFLPQFRPHLKSEDYNKGN